ncbi:Hypp6127 [Branchiostoma lanceolatum]|uniref:Hypp6127 protein n=1 Tax=Branchiostoma lanceolatum TaxID=7740 RepID=A0A8J9VME7_BRALA|nr:Hypp6127 [Branchiostoma lanceolatum]
MPSHHRQANRPQAMPRHHRQANRPQVMPSHHRQSNRPQVMPNHHRQANRHRAAPNSRQNTAVFCIFNAKDTREHINLATARYAKEISDLQEAKWTLPVSELQHYSLLMSQLQHHSIPVSELQQHSLLMSQLQHHSIPVSELQHHSLPVSELQHYSLLMSQLQHHSILVSELQHHSLLVSELQHYSLLMSQLQHHSILVSELQHHSLLVSELQHHSLLMSQLQHHSLPVSELQHHSLLVSELQHYSLLMSQLQHHSIPVSELQHHSLLVSELQHHSLPVSELQHHSLLMSQLQHHSIPVSELQHYSLLMSQLQHHSLPASQLHQTLESADQAAAQAEEESGGGCFTIMPVARKPPLKKRVTTCKICAATVDKNHNGLIKTLSEEHINNWNLKLDGVLYALRTKEQTTTKNSPVLHPLWKGSQISLTDPRIARGNRGGEWTIATRFVSADAEMDNKAGECKDRWILTYCCLLVHLNAARKSGPDLAATTTRLQGSALLPNSSGCSTQNQRSNIIPSPRPPLRHDVSARTPPRFVVSARPPLHPDVGARPSPRSDVSVRPSPRSDVSVRPSPRSDVSARPSPRSDVSVGPSPRFVLSCLRISDHSLHIASGRFWEELKKVLNVFKKKQDFIKELEEAAIRPDLVREQEEVLQNAEDGKQREKDGQGEHGQSGLALGILCTDNDGACLKGTNEALSEAGLPPAEKQECVQHNGIYHLKKAYPLDLEVFQGGNATKVSRQKAGREVGNYIVNTCKDALYIAHDHHQDSDEDFYAECEHLRITLVNCIAGDHSSYTSVFECPQHNPEDRTAADIQGGGNLALTQSDRVAPQQLVEYTA